MASKFEIVSVPEGSPNAGKPAAILLEGLLDADPERLEYTKILEEVRPHLAQGDVVVYGQTFAERRLTAFFSTEDCPMEYSGRELQPTRPLKGGVIDTLFRAFALDEMKGLFRDLVPDFEIEMPDFNAVFVNWYRPPNEKEADEKPDGLGWHADDERSHASDIIMSITYCEENGERFFQFRPKNATSGVLWKKELPHHSIVLMLPGCQDELKHCVSDRKTNSKKKTITGGRVNLTFRALAVPK